MVRLVLSFALRVSTGYVAMKENTTRNNTYYKPANQTYN